MLPKLSYNLYFEHKTEDAVKELNTDIRRTLRGTLRSVDSPPPNKFLQQTDSYLHGWASVDTVRFSMRLWNSVAELIVSTDPSDSILHFRRGGLLGGPVRKVQV